MTPGSRAVTGSTLSSTPRAEAIRCDNYWCKGCHVSVHFFVQFEPAPGKEAEFRSELLKVAEPSRTEEGCVALHVFESLCVPFRFAIHSEWVDEAAFELHSRLPHTLQFLRAAEQLLMHDVQGLRAREIDGGAGAGASG